MTDKDICDQDAYRDDDYTQQYELPEIIPNLSYQYIKCLCLHGTARLAADSAHLEDGNEEPIKDLGFWLTAATKEDELDGTAVEAGPTLEDRIRKLLAPSMIMHLPTTMDFSLRHPTRVVIVLKGSYWQFPSRKHPITMKHDYNEQYVDLKYHYVDANGQLLTYNLPPTGRSTEPFRCFSFTAGQPCYDNGSADKNIHHGFSINLEFVRAGYRPLELSFDPDVENKGERPPHPPTA